MLDSDEWEWINDYHARVLEEIGPLNVLRRPGTPVTSSYVTPPETTGLHEAAHKPSRVTESINAGHCLLGKNL